MPSFQLISWCVIFVERHSFYNRKLSEITVFYTVLGRLLAPTYDRIAFVKLQASTLVLLKLQTVRGLIFSQVTGF